ESRECAVDRDGLVLLGASNGTTSVLDYTVGHDEQLPDAKALALVSPGSYTENQHEIADYGPTLEELSILWVFPDNEPWSLQFEEEAPENWDFVELEDGRHGTNNFKDDALKTALQNAIVNWLQSLP
ncbi:MAG: hypothetical protein KC561_18470, partial [Myxococcales bacterium]|nr:hypothetical protein [Myxococcales bacterium]